MITEVNEASDSLDKEAVPTSLSLRIRLCEQSFCPAMYKSPCTLTDPNVIFERYLDESEKSVLSTSMLTVALDDEERPSNVTAQLGAPTTVDEQIFVLQTLAIRDIND